MKRVLFFLLVLTATFWGFSSCDETGGKITVTEPETEISTKSFDTYVHLEFVDAKTGEYLRGEKVTLSLSGKDANEVYNNLGLRGSTFSTEIGMYDLVVDPAKTSSDFVIKVSAAGYNDYTHHAQLIDARFTPIRIPLVNLSDLPDGVSTSAATQITTDSQGKTLSEVIIPVNSANTVVIPAGSVFKDAQGKAVTGNVDSKILFYDPAQAADIFPGGLNVVAQGIGGNSELSNISFISAGLFDIELTSGNNRVSTIEGPGIEITTTLNSSVINPHTEQPVAAGDAIELWSMNPETGVWDYEKTATIKQNGSGELYLQENIFHLSSWNWDWFVNSCYEGATIKWEGNASGVYIRVKNQHPINSYSTSCSAYVDVNDSYYNKLTFYYVPQGMPTTMTFEAESSYSSCGSGNVTISPPILTIPNLCEQKIYTVQVNTDNSDNYTVNMNLSISPKSNPNIKIQLNGYIYLLPACGYYYDYYPIQLGVSKLNIKKSTDYQISAYLGIYYGYGYLRVEEAANNKLKVTLTPDFVYNYYNWNYLPNLKTEERIVDKPVNGIIDVSFNFLVDDNVLSSIY
jgi:hypothetical protein